MGSGKPVYSFVALAWGFIAWGVPGQAGRPGEDGSGAVWIAPELVAPPRAPTPCNAESRPRATDLVFETRVVTETADAQLPRLLAASTRQGVRFDWNAATGELTFDVAAPAAVFSDLQRVAAPAAALQNTNCTSD